MRIITQIDEMTEIARGWLTVGPVGFAALSGPLHQGHTTLVQAATRESDICIVCLLDKSLFFPLSSYPVTALATLETQELDIRLLQECGTDVVFIPQQKELYPPNFVTYISPDIAFTERLERVTNWTSSAAALRQYATTIAKLFQIIRPDIAFLGQKDAIQIALMRQLVRDLNIDINLYVHPTVREPGGLALSIRNRFLTAEQRQSAAQLSQTLRLAQAQIENGIHESTEILNTIRDTLARTPHLSLEYTTICHPDSFIGVSSITPGTLITVGAHLDSVLLTDNLLWDSDGRWHM